MTIHISIYICVLVRPRFVYIFIVVLCVYYLHFFLSSRISYS